MLGKINLVLCGIIMPIFLILVGFFLLFKLKFFYILHPIKTVKSMLKGGFKPLTLALAGTLGVGNIVGVASAIIAGGAGAVFWMWVSAFLVMSIKYTEVTLAMKHRQIDKSGSYYGGAPYYISNELSSVIGKKPAFIIACCFALLCTINSLTTGNLVQVNSVASLLPVPKLIFGIVFALLVFLVIIGGRKWISSITAVLIPILSVFYIVVVIYVVISNSSQIPTVFSMIFKDAFSFKCATSGFMGYGIMASIRYGVSRGILSNEAGCGTSPTAHASSSTRDIHSQGCLGIFEVFVDTILLCTLTAVVILIWGKGDTEPMSLIVNAFYGLSGVVGKYGVIISSLLFSFATVTCQYYYGIEALNFLSKSKTSKAIFAVVFAITTLIGAIIPMALMWQISDFVIALMTISNILCIIFIKNESTV